MSSGGKRPAIGPMPRVGRLPRPLAGPPGRGQATVMFALMITVLFGMLALIIDLGFVMIERRQQQNAADSVARGVARLLAGAVGVNSSGNLAFVEMYDYSVMAKAQPLAAGNWVGGGASRSIAVDYLDCAGTLIRTADATNTPNLAVPGTTCRVRARGTTTRSSFFIRVANPAQTTLGASASATARIAPTSMPPSSTGFWPITRWKNHPNAAANCTVYQPGAVCVFWSNNGGSEDTSLGSFKEKLYFSRDSQCEYLGPPTLQLITQHDTARPGSPCAASSVKQADMEYWFSYGFGGRISVGNKIEITDPGNQGNNFASQMLFYVNAKPEGVDATWGNWRVVRVVLWEVGDRWHSGSGTFQCWPASAGPACVGGSNPDRITVSEIRCFKFYATWIDSSEVRGQQVSCEEPGGTPGGGPPSSVANTVVVVD